MESKVISIDRFLAIAKLELLTLTSFQFFKHYFKNQRGIGYVVLINKKYLYTSLFDLDGLRFVEWDESKVQKYYAKDNEDVFCRLKMFYEKKETKWHGVGNYSVYWTGISIEFAEFPFKTHFFKFLPQIA